MYVDDDGDDDIDDNNYDDDNDYDDDDDYNDDGKNTYIKSYRLQQGAKSMFWLCVCLFAVDDGDTQAHTWKTFIKICRLVRAVNDLALYQLMTSMMGMMTRMPMTTMMTRMTMTPMMTRIHISRSASYQCFGCASP